MSDDYSSSQLQNVSIHEEMHFNINSSEWETQAKPCAIIDLEAMSPRDQTIANEMTDFFH